MIWNLISVFIGVVGIFLAVQYRKKNRIEIINSLSESSENFYLGNIGALKVTYDDVSYNNISAHEIVFINTGSDGIDDVLGERAVTFYTDEDNEIIDYEIITKTKINDDTKLTRVSRNEVALSFSWLGRNSGVRVKFLTDAKDAPKIRGKVQGHPPFEKNQIVRSSNLIQIIYEEMNSLVNFADNWVKPFLAGFAVLLLLFLAYTYFQITSNGDVIIEVPVEYFVDNIDESKINGFNHLNGLLTVKGVDKLSTNYDDRINTLYDQYSSAGFDVSFTPYINIEHPEVGRIAFDEVGSKYEKINIIISKSDSDKTGVIIESLYYLFLILVGSLLILIFGFSLFFCYKFISFRRAMKYFYLLSLDEKNYLKSLFSDHFTHKALSWFLSK